MLFQAEQNRSISSVTPVMTTGGNPVRGHPVVAPEHAQLPTALGNHHPGSTPNTGPHRFHPYPRPEQPVGVTGKVEAHRDLSRDPRLRVRAAANGHMNGNGIMNGNALRKENLPTGSGSGGTISDPSVRNIINSSRDPRQRNR